MGIQFLWTIIVGKFLQVLINIILFSPAILVALLLYNYFVKKK